MIIHKYKSSKYKCNLYETNEEILILDIFYDNPKEYRIELYYHDNTVNIIKYKIHEYYHYINNSESWWGGYDVREEEKEKIDEMKINFNKIYPMLKNYSIYNAEKRKNISMITFIKKNLLKDFSPQINENKILFRWFP